MYYSKSLIYLVVFLGIIIKSLEQVIPPNSWFPNLHKTYFVYGTIENVWNPNRVLLHVGDRLEFIWDGYNNVVEVNNDTYEYNGGFRSGSAKYNSSWVWYPDKQGNYSFISDAFPLKMFGTIEVGLGFPQWIPDNENNANLIELNNLKLFSIIFIIHLALRIREAW